MSERDWRSYLGKNGFSSLALSLDRLSLMILNHPTIEVSQRRVASCWRRSYLSLYMGRAKQGEKGKPSSYEVSISVKRGRASRQASDHRLCCCSSRSLCCRYLYGQALSFTSPSVLKGSRLLPLLLYAKPSV